MDENSEPQIPPDDDRTPTQEDAPPPPKKPDAWVMPEPVFRQTSGYLPKGFEKNFEPGRSDLPDDASAEALTAEELASGPAPAPAVAAQPDLSEAILSQELADEPVSSVRTKSRGWRVLFIVLGFGIVILIVLAIIAGVVFWYFYQASESQNLN